MKSRPDLTKVKWEDWKAVNKPIDWKLWTQLSQDALKSDLLHKLVQFLEYYYVITAFSYSL